MKLVKLSEFTKAKAIARGSGHISSQLQDEQAKALQEDLRMFGWMISLYNPGHGFLWLVITYHPDIKQNNVQKVELRIAWLQLSSSITAICPPGHKNGENGKN